VLSLLPALRAAAQAAPAGRDVAPEVAVKSVTATILVKDRKVEAMVVGLLRHPDPAVRADALRPMLRAQSVQHRHGALFMELMYDPNPEVARLAGQVVDQMTFERGPATRRRLAQLLEWPRGGAPPEPETPTAGAVDLSWPEAPKPVATTPDTGVPWGRAVSLATCAAVAAAGFTAAMRLSGLRKHDDV
jgi:hypothetical protein